LLVFFAFIRIHHEADRSHFVSIRHRHVIHVLTVSRRAYFMFTSVYYSLKQNTIRSPYVNPQTVILWHLKTHLFRQS